MRFLYRLHIAGTLTDHEASVRDSLDMEQHFPRSLLHLFPTCCRDQTRTTLPGDGVSEMFENPLPHNSSVMKCLKLLRAGEEEGRNEVVSGSVTNPLQVF